MSADGVRIPNASTKTSDRHLNDAGVELLGHIPSEGPNPFCWRLRDQSKRPWAAEPGPGVRLRQRPAQNRVRSRILIIDLLRAVSLASR
jgi:hypothetical protein